MTKKDEAEFLIESVLADNVMSRIVRDDPMCSIKRREQKLLEVLGLNAGYVYNMEATNLLVQLYIADGRHENAISYFEKLASFATENDLILAADLAANACASLKLYKIGIHIYELALLKFKHPKLMNGISYFYGKTRQYDLALQYSKMAVEAEPKNPFFLNDYGYTLFKMGRLEEARSAYEKGAGLKSDYELIRNNLKECETAIIKRNNQKITAGGTYR